MKEYDVRISYLYYERFMHEIVYIEAPNSFEAAKQAKVIFLSNWKGSKLPTITDLKVFRRL